MSDWTDKMDARLIQAREASPPVGWKRLLLEPMFMGVSRPEAERHYRDLKAGSPSETVRRVDGLEWLKEKKRLNVRQLAAAEDYRGAFRFGGGAKLRSSMQLLLQGGGGGGAGALTPVEVSVEAQRRLFFFRNVVLRQQDDMLTVMDAVCGIGMTLRELTAGDGHRAAQWEAVLRVALDLVIAGKPGRGRADPERIVRVGKKVA